MIKQASKMLIPLILYYGFAQYLPNQPFPGYKFGYALRRLLVRNLFSCGNDVIIKRKANFGKGTGILLGNRSQLGVNSFIGEGTHIGDDVIMAPNVIIWSISHDFSRTDIPINQQGSTALSPVTIGDDIWIGQNVVIMPGVHIGDHSIIGTGAVVTRDVEPWAIMGGIPAKLIRTRQ